MSLQQQTKPFLCNYHHQGDKWCVTIHAYDWDDAEARCKKLGLNLDGELKATIPARAGLLAKVVCALANWIRNLLTPVRGD
jgi:hypothetical protein